MIDVITAPRVQILTRILLINRFDGWVIRETRISPYLPNLRRIAARIIDPATGASTCAFGSHRWNRNIGILTKKAIIRRSHQIVFIMVEEGGVTH